MAALTTTPSHESQVPQNLYIGVATHILGALDPNILQMQGLTIGNTRMKVDIYGDALGSTPLTGDRWRTAHDAFALQVYLDGEKLGLFIRREVYGIFLRFMSEAGQNSYNNLSEFEKRSLTIVPDLTTEHTAEGSPIQAPGVQMWELKRLHAVNATSTLSATSTRQEPTPSTNQHKLDQFRMHPTAEQPKYPESTRTKREKQTRRTDTEAQHPY